MLGRANNKPFAHFQLDYALPVSEYALLEHAMPHFCDLKGAPGCDRVNIDCERIENASWKRFVEQNSSARTFNRLAEIFENPVRIEPEDVSMRSDPRRTRYKCCIQVGMNGMNIKNSPNKVMECHLDKPNKIFVLLLYMRHPEDTAKGGDLHLHETIESPPNVICPYSRNRMIGFSNHEGAFHSVSHRPRSLHPRRFVNIVFERNF